MPNAPSLPGVILRPVAGSSAEAVPMRLPAMAAGCTVSAVCWGRGVLFIRIRNSLFRSVVRAERISMSVLSASNSPLTMIGFACSPYTVPGSKPKMRCGPTFGVMKPRGNEIRRPLRISASAKT